MGKASFSVGKLTQHSQSHINRENGLNYNVVENSRANSFNKYYEYDEFLQKAQDRYKEKVKQNMQNSAIANIFQEAIIAIDGHHTSEDILDLFFELKQKYGGHELISLTIHKDEGYFTKNNQNFYPHKNILKKEDNNWYITQDGLNGKKPEDFSQKVDISEFSTVLTPHAHAIFSMFDFSLGRNARMQKKDMMERLRFVATLLKMDYSLQKINKISNNDTNLDLKDSEEIDLNSQMTIKNSYLIEINTQLRAKELELEEVISKLRVKQSMLNDILIKISQKETILDELNTQMFIKEEDLENLSNIISMKNTTINNLNLTIKQKEFKIDELDSKIYGISQTMAI
ncbi:hypothetical protein N5T90_04770 [Aliarcobacter cryaerophilus]|uniref:hypothetical protein n=1 Tax=Aliarcobacter cryaerophilus TaxID=28198 RepID=UPI0021B5F853|nr:hypothetical protein [Aliarcobacter cryaerophilus]MCT7470177.1 hypothetical protein [Aliarcobacter cryaerophilus]